MRNFWEENPAKKKKKRERRVVEQHQQIMDLNKLITTIQGLSDNENDLKSLKTQLNKFEEVLVKNNNLLEDALNTLDPNRHSLGWLFILYD